MAFVGLGAQASPGGFGFTAGTTAAGAQAAAAAAAAQAGKVASFTAPAPKSTNVWGGEGELTLGDFTYSKGDAIPTAATLAYAKALANINAGIPGWGYGKNAAGQYAPGFIGGQSSSLGQFIGNALKMGLGLTGPTGIFATTLGLMGQQGLFGKGIQSLVGSLTPGFLGGSSPGFNAMTSQGPALAGPGPVGQTAASSAPGLYTGPGSAMASGYMGPGSAMASGYTGPGSAIEAPIFSPLQAPSQPASSIQPAFQLSENALNPFLISPGSAVLQSSIF